MIFVIVFGLVLIITLVALPAKEGKGGKFHHLGNRNKFTRWKHHDARLKKN